MFYNKEKSNEYLLIDQNYEKTNEFKKYISDLKLYSVSLSNLKILDFGCGTLRYLKAFDSFSLYVGIDISIFMLTANKIKLKYLYLINGDLNSVKIKNIEGFNFIFSIGVLGEYSIFDRKVSVNLFNLLRPNGILYIGLVDAKKNNKIKYFYKLLTKLIVTRNILFSQKYFRHCYDIIYQIRLIKNWISVNESRRIILSSGFRIINYYNFYDGKFYKHIYILKRCENEINNNC